MIVTILFAAIILMGCIALLSVRMILKKDGRFPDMHVGNHAVLREKGISCARTQDREAAGRKTLAERMMMN
jgi:hypothetical protein